MKNRIVDRIENLPVYAETNKYIVLEKENTFNEFLFPLTISEEKNVLANLPKELFNNKFIKEVLYSILENIEYYECDGIVLNKMKCVDEDDDSVVVEWNYNYFRCYFYFDLKNLNESEAGMIYRLSNESSSRRLSICENNYKSVVREVFNFILGNSINYRV